MNLPYMELLYLLEKIRASAARGYAFRTYPNGLDEDHQLAVQLESDGLIVEDYYDASTRHKDWKAVL